MTRFSNQQTNNDNGMYGRISRLAVTGATVMALFASLGFASTALGKEKEFKFTNNSSEDASDLHIEFHRGSLEVTGETPDDALPLNDADDSRNTVNFKKGLSGNGVDKGDSIIIKFKYSGSDPKVKSAKWTKGNTLDPGPDDFIKDGAMDANDITCAWQGNQAAGDGVYLVMIDAQPREFVTFPGEPAEAVSDRFAQFIEEWQFGDVLAQDPGVVQWTGNSFFPDMPNAMIDVLQQDSQLPLLLDGCQMQLDVYNLVAGERAEFVVTDHHEGAIVAIVYSLKPGYTGVNGSYGYCGSLGLAGVTPEKLIGQGPIVGGQFSRALPIPPDTAGLELHMQAILRDTCPTSCESNVVSLVIK